MAEMVDVTGAALLRVPDGAGCETWDAAPSELAPLGKRIFDAVFALVLLSVLAPVLLVAAVAVKLSSRGPVLFRQQRIGRGGRTFSVLKLRTMYVDSERRLALDGQLRKRYVAGDHKIPSAEDPRVTRVGHLLRTWSLDELPQLVNVLMGDMSLVGPRPVVPDELAEYAHLTGHYLAMRPGLTGLWQVSGRSEVKFPARAELDALYQERCSPWLDLKVIAKTPAAILLRRGAE